MCLGLATGCQKRHIDFNELCSREMWGENPELCIVTNPLNVEAAVVKMEGYGLLPIYLTETCKENTAYIMLVETAKKIIEEDNNFDRGS